MHLHVEQRAKTTVTRLEGTDRKRRDYARRCMASRRTRQGMTATDFKRIALSLEGAEEGSHMGAVDFRVGGGIFATLASVAQGYGNLALTPTEQQVFVEELPEVFVPVAGGGGRVGMTHLGLAEAREG